LAKTTNAPAYLAFVKAIEKMGLSLFKPFFANMEAKIS